MAPPVQCSCQFLKNEGRVYLMTTEKTTKTKFDNLPENMSVKDIALFLGVSKSTAYNIANSNDFPRLKTPGRRLVIVPKAGFINWYNENCVTASELKAE